MIQKLCSDLYQYSYSIKKKVVIIIKGAAVQVYGLCLLAIATSVIISQFYV